MFNNCTASETSVVLIASKASSIQPLDRKDIRRLFLGLPAIHNSFVHKPVLNTSNPKTYRNFLKNVMYLTEGGYHRKLVKRIFRQGADEIKSIDTQQALISHLTANPSNISFMLKETAEQEVDLVIIQSLW